MSQAGKYLRDDGRFYVFVAYDRRNEWAFQSFKKAKKFALKASDQLGMRPVILVEAGRLSIEGEPVALVAFWWNTEAHSHFREHPVKRGRGFVWGQEYLGPVNYNPYVGDLPAETVSTLPPPPKALGLYANPDNLPPPVRFVERTCADCGIILPQNEMQKVREETEIGRTSGALHFSWSILNGLSRRSGRSRHTTSYLTGRTYFAVQTRFKCSACAAESKERAEGLWAKLLRSLR